GLRAIELDLDAAGEEAHGFRRGRDLGPGRRFRDAGKHRNRLPHVLDPWARRSAPLHDDADRQTTERDVRAQLTLSGKRIGSPTTRFCGLTRSIPSAVIARIK